MAIAKYGFDNEKYLKEQREEIRRRAEKYGKLYLEFGGKLMNDNHAARCLPGYDPNVKLRLLQSLKDQAEIILAIYLVVVIILVTGRTIVVETPLIFTEGVSIHHFLEGSLTLAVAIEFIKMLCMHTPGTLIEVLLFAIARHMIVESLTPIQNLIIVIAIVILFAARKYLLTPHDQKGMNEHVHSAKGIISEIVKLREERHSYETAVEGSKERKHLEKARRAILQEEAKKTAE